MKFISEDSLFGEHIRDASSVIHQVRNTTDESTDNAESPEALTIYIRMPSHRKKELSLLKSCFCKIRSNCVKTCSIRFKIQYDVNKTEF